MRPKETITGFDTFLAKRELSFTPNSPKPSKTPRRSSPKPTNAELEEITPWLETQDANPDWPAHTHATLDDLQRRLGHGV